MITKRTKFLVILAGAGLAATASAQELMVFPNDGQDKEQQQQDEFTCYNWAKGETGFDPMVVPTATAPPPQQAAPKGGVRRGAVRGAAIGAVAGGNSSDIGKAAESDAIDSVEDLDNHLIVQGVQGSTPTDPLGWSLSINQTTGRMTLTASGDDAGFVAFGACTAL